MLICMERVYPGAPVVTRHKAAQLLQEALEHIAAADDLFECREDSSPRAALETRCTNIVTQTIDDRMLHAQLCLQPTPSQTALPRARNVHVEALETRSTN